MHRKFILFSFCSLQINQTNSNSLKTTTSRFIHVQHEMVDIIDAGSITV